MLSMNPARKRPTNRTQTQSDKTPEAQTQTWPAPTAGLITNVNAAVAPAESMTTCENFLPTERGPEPRGGYVIKATTPGVTRSLFQYRANGAEKFFAADDTGIYPFSPATPNGTALTATVTGQTSGDYSALESQTAGGSFLSVVNGTDIGKQFNGTTWSDLVLTGVSSAALSHVWAYANRQFFIKKGTMSAFYLGVNSIAGAATELPLAGVFNKGGVLLFGDTWSSDAGDGLDDRCVFVTDQGEVAIYTGTDPSNVNTWSLEGVFSIGVPLGRSAYFKIGGDILIATEQGLIPLSAAVQKDQSSLSLYAVSNAIDPNWRASASVGALCWTAMKYERGGYGFLSPGDCGASEPVVYVVNLRSGAWATFTGWNVGAMAELGDYPFFTDGNSICQAETGGLDNGNPFVCRLAYSASHLNAPGAYKTGQMMRATFRYQAPFRSKLSLASDYSVSFPSPPSGAVDGTSTPSVWDVALWDVSSWSAGMLAAQYGGAWSTVSGQGQVIAPQVQILSASTGRTDAQLVSVDLVYSTGQAVV